MAICILYAMRRQMMTIIFICDVIRRIFPHVFSTVPSYDEPYLLDRVWNARTAN